LPGRLRCIKGQRRGKDRRRLDVWSHNTARVRLEELDESQTKVSVLSSQSSQRMLHLIATTEIFSIDVITGQDIHDTGGL